LLLISYKKIQQRLTCTINNTVSFHYTIKPNISNSGP